MRSPIMEAYKAVQSASNTDTILRQQLANLPNGKQVLEVLDQLGKMPLPPYIAKQLCSNDRYQTVYAKYDGRAAAPTAGFHFTPELFEKIKAMGIEVIDITLHIGLGTFRPVKVQDTKDHVMHSEVYEIIYEAAEK